MVIVVLGISVIPLLFSFAGSSQAPFLFSSSWRLGVALGCAFFLCVFYWPLITDRVIRSLIAKRVLSWWILFAVAGNCEYLLFAWSTNYVDISVSTILYEVWPLFLIWITAYLYKHDARYSKISYASLPLLILPFIGYMLAIASQSGELPLIFNEGISSTIKGAMLALGAAILAPMMAFGFKWGSDLSSEITNMRKQTSGKYQSLDMFCAIIAFFISSLGASVVNLTAGIIAQETITIQMVIIGVIGGVTANAIGGIAWRKAHFSTDNLGVHAIAYFIPVAALIFLFAFNQANIIKPDYLIIGSVIIVAANIVLNFKAEIGWGFKALIITLGACGAITYLRESIFQNWMNVTEWNWSSSGYFESIAVSATVFTLLLAFRVARLVSRTNDEASLLFGIYRKLELMVNVGILSSDILGYIREIDNSKNSSRLRNAYTKARKCIAKADSQNSDSREMLIQAESDLDALVRSKQMGLVFGEMFAIVIFAGITISLALFTRPPETQGWILLMIDLFAMLISSVIVFLVVYVFDLDRERDGSKLEHDTETGRYLIKFPETRERILDQGISVATGIGIVITYVVLLMDKWLG